MGASIQWRRPPPNLASRSYGREVEFGRGRSAGRAFMAASDRVGPGVLIIPAVGSSGRSDAEHIAFATALNEEGFTALLLEGAYGDRTPDVLDAAGAFLTDNWHPRLGVVGFGTGVPEASAAAARLGAEALVVYEDAPGRGWNPGRTALLGHVIEPEEEAATGVFRQLEAAGSEVELWSYATATEVRGPEARARTVDFLTYYLS